MDEQPPEPDSGYLIRPKGPIPEELYSEYEERPFRTCTRCGESLIHFQEGYRVSKVFRAGEVIFEYALCLPCLNNIMKESSEESKERLQEFQNSRVRDVDGFSDCALCDRTRETTRNGEFGLVGACLGDQLLDGNMICSFCMEEMSELVSEQTRRTWDRFVEENFPGVPSDFAPMPSHPQPLVM